MTVCPICADPADEAAVRCGRCGWELRGEPILGWADDALIAAFERRLDQTAADHDLAAAVRSGATLAEAATLGLRGGAPSAEAWLAASAKSHDTVPADPTDGLPGDVLKRLTAGTSPAVHFVGLSTANIEVHRVAADDDGFAARDGDVQTIEWVTANVAADPVLGRFQLAGGIGAKAVDRDDFDHAVEQALEPLGGSECVLVCPDPGWSLLDRAQAVVRRSASVTTTIARGPEPCDLGTIVEDVLLTASLPFDYEVMLQQVDPTDGTVELVTRRLFAEGTRADQAPMQRVAVHGSPVGNELAAIPVVGRRGSDPRKWPVLAIGRTNLPARSMAWVEFTLASVKDVRFARTDGLPVTPLNGTSLSDLLATVPKQVPLAPPIELICAIELCGAEDDVRARLEFVHRLVELVDADHPGRGMARFGVVGYLDHRDRDTAMYSSSALVGDPTLGSAESAQASVRGLGWYRPLRDGATAMEDALEMAADLSWNAAPSVDRVLVLVGRRPPNLRVARGPVAACPAKADWTDAVQRLRSRGVRIVAVREAGPVTKASGADGATLRKYADSTWQALAGPHLLALDAAAPENVSALTTPQREIPPSAFPLGLATPQRQSL